MQIIRIRRSYKSFENFCFARPSITEMSGGHGTDGKSETNVSHRKNNQGLTMGQEEKEIHLLHDENEGK